MDKTFYKKIIKFQSFLIDNFKIIDEDVTKRNRKINFNHIIYTCFNKFINHTSELLHNSVINVLLINIFCYFIKTPTKNKNLFFIFLIN